MKKFSVKLLREFEVDIQAENGEMATQIASSVLAQFPKGSCKLLSIIAEDAGECQACKDGPVKSDGNGGGNGGPPNLGGSPGTPVVRQDVLVDQVAEAA